MRQAKDVETMERMTGPVLVLGLDMADGALIRRWSRQGRLPHLADLARAGATLELDTPADALHTSTWPTFATGVLPGQHGVYYPYQPTPGQQFARQIGPDQYGARTLWSRADAAGRSCLVYDVPETFPENGFRGRAIYDWGTWAHYGSTSAQPHTLLRELRSRFGRYPLGYEAMRLGFAHPEGIDAPLLESVRYKSATAQWLLQQADWDLAVIGFGETHCAGHYLWPPGARVEDADGDPRFERLFDVYAALDAAIGALRTNLPATGTLLVVSGDGVRANHCGWHLLPPLLARLGYASLSGQPGTNDGAGARPSLMARVGRIVPAGLKQRIADTLPLRTRNRLGLMTQAAAYDWPRTRAFALPTDLEGCVRLNVRDREPQGIVEPGAEYEDLCRELRTRLEELVNPATGAPAVDRVWIRNEIFPGPRQEELPDLIVTWRDDAPIAALTSPRAGTVEGANPDSRPGTHSTAGLLVAHGPGIPEASEARGRLVDLAPTILHRLGVPDTGGLEGTAWRPDANLSIHQERP